MGTSSRRTRTRTRVAVPSRHLAVLVAVATLALLWNSGAALTDTLRAFNIIGAQPMRLVVEGEPVPGLTQEALDAVPAPLSQSPQTVVFKLGPGGYNNVAMKAEPLPGVNIVHISPLPGANEQGQLEDPWIGVTPSRELAARAPLPEVAAATQQVVFRANMKLGQNVTAARAMATSIATIVDGPPVARTPVGRWALSALLAVGVALSAVAWAAARRRERTQLSRLRTSRRRVAGVVLDLDALEVAAPDGAAGGASALRRRLQKQALALNEELAEDPRPDSLARQAARAQEASLELEAQADSIFLLSSLGGRGESAERAWEQLATPVVTQLEYDGRHELAAKARSFLETASTLSPSESRACWNALFTGAPRLNVELGGPRLSLRALDLTLRALRTPIDVAESSAVRGDAADVRRVTAAERRATSGARHQVSRPDGRGMLGRKRGSRALRVMAVAVLGLAVLIVPSAVGAAIDQAAYQQDRERYVHPTPFGPSRVVSVETGGDLDGLPSVEDLRAAVRDIPVSEDTRVVVLGMPRFDAGGDYAMEILAELRRTRADLFDPHTMEPRTGNLLVTVGTSRGSHGLRVAGNVFSVRPNLARDVESSLRWRQAVAPNPFMWRDADAVLPSVSGQVQSIVNNYSAGFVQDSAFAERSQGGRVAGVLTTLMIAALLLITRSLTSLWRHRRAARAGRQARACFHRTAHRLDQLLLREDEAALNAAAAARAGAGAAVGLREAGVAYAGRLREELGGLRRWQWRPAAAQRTQTLFAAVVADLERQDESIERAAERALVRREDEQAATREGS